MSLPQSAKLSARASFHNGSSKVTYQEAPFHNAKSCEISLCDSNFFFGGRHHCRVCGNSVCVRHCFENVVLTSPLIHLPMTYDKVCSQCFHTHKHDEAMRQAMAQRIQKQWKRHRWNEIDVEANIALRQQIDEANLLNNSDDSLAVLTPVRPFHQSLSIISSLLHTPTPATDIPVTQYQSPDKDCTNNNTILVTSRVTFQDNISSPQNNGIVGMDNDVGSPNKSENNLDAIQFMSPMTNNSIDESRDVITPLTPHNAPRHYRNTDIDSDDEFSGRYSTNNTNRSSRLNISDNYSTSELSTPVHDSQHNAIGSIDSNAPQTSGFNANLNDVLSAMTATVESMSTRLTDTLAGISPIPANRQQNNDIRSTDNHDNSICSDLDTTIEYNAQSPIPLLSHSATSTFYSPMFSPMPSSQLNARTHEEQPVIVVRRRSNLINIDTSNTSTQDDTASTSSTGVTTEGGLVSVLNDILGEQHCDEHQQEVIGAASFEIVSGNEDDGLMSLSIEEAAAERLRIQTSFSQSCDAASSSISESSSLRGSSESSHYIPPQKAASAVSIKERTGMQSGTVDCVESTEDDVIAIPKKRTSNTIIIEDGFDRSSSSIADTLTADKLDDVVSNQTSSTHRSNGGNSGGTTTARTEVKDSDGGVCLLCGFSLF